MNSKQQAKKGFKTFLLTLVISLIVFGGIYYLINSQVDNTGDYDVSQESYEDYEGVLGTETAGDEEEVEIETSKDETTPEVEEESVFEDLANQKMEKSNGSEQVLAGADVASDTTTDTTATQESTVPDTGISGPTMGVIMTLIILGFAAYIMFLGPRNVALHNFEKDFLDDLEK